MTAGIVGVDFSLTACAVVSSVGWHVVIGSDGDAAATYPQRLERLKAHGNRILELVAGADLAVLEGPSYASKNNARTWDRAGAWWQLYRSLAGAGVPVAVAPPSSVKLFAAGKGNASKGAVVVAVTRRWPEWDTGGDDNVCDAVALMELGRAYRAVADSGSRLLPVAEARALAGVEWPEGVDQ